MNQEFALVPSTSTWSVAPDSEPIPGYRLIEPLGKGGFGEVWKCEAPGGLFKAIKFVANDNEKARLAEREQQALQRIKTIRHPYILSIERVERIDGVLVVVMELADKSLFNLFNEYHNSRLPGIPREELLGYMLEVAEALDWMNFGHGLQHLDIKPHNLFLIGNHVKVADFGLVKRFTETDADRSSPSQHQFGLTPLYVSPELLRGQVSRQCDQYSLAIVYQQLLTGTLPFWSQDLFQLMLLHGTAQPDLLPLPPADRPIVARSLAKRPEDRYPSCMDFLQHLVCGDSGETPRSPRASAVVRRLFVARYQANSTGDNPPSPKENALDEVCSLRSPDSPTIPSLECADNQAVTPVVRHILEARRSLIEEEDRGVDRCGEEVDASTHNRIAVSGHNFLRCLGRSPLGEVWEVEDKKGQKRRALCLHDIVGGDAKILERLKEFRHPILAPFDLCWSNSGRLVLIAEAYRLSLRDRLGICQKQGLPGIPRNELTFYLRTVAGALDALYAEYEMPHLGLHPRCLALHSEGVWILDYGLTPLVWLPTGQPASAVNRRYAAPELFEKLDIRGIPQGKYMTKALMGRAGSTADQFGLALIYAEMLNGIPPRSIAPSARRPTKSDSGGREAIPLQPEARLDFDLLPSCDRIPLLKALQADPQQRFPSCVALVDALEEAAVVSNHRATLYHQLPNVIPFSSLRGEPEDEALSLPSLDRFVLGLALSELSSPPRIVEGPRSARYSVRDNDLWECKFPVHIFSGVLPLKLEGFRSEWRLKIVEQSSDRFLFLMELPRTLPSAAEPTPRPGVALEVKVTSAFNSPKYFAEACLSVYPTGGERERVAKLLVNLTPRFVESLRGYMQANAEQRGQDRWGCPQPLHVYPVRRDLEFEEILEGMSRNISLGGVSIRVAKKPSTEQVYLHWHKSPAASSFAVLARIVRTQPMIGGGFEIGGVFASETPEIHELE